MQHIWNDEPLKTLVDATSVGVAVGTLAGYLPSVAALVTIVWGLIRIWETDTVRGLTGRRPQATPLDKPKGEE